MDLMFVLMRLPVPFPGDKFSVFTLVVYDENEVVKDIAADLWSHGSVGETWGDNYVITAGEFSFINIVNSKPDTILGPQISWQDLAGMTVPERSCSLVLVMGDCPMEQVSLDTKLIADLSPAGDYCVLNMGSPPRKRHLFGTFIQKIIPEGSHRLSIHQGAGHSDFEADFECAAGETIYAEIEVQPWGSSWYDGHIAGSISIKKSIPNNVVEMDKLRQILWRQDRWYGPSNSTEMDTFVKKAQAEREKQEKQAAAEAEAEAERAKKEKRDAAWLLYLMQPTDENLVWLCRAADEGHASARNELGELYFYGSDQYRKFKGLHIQVDLSRACMWFNLADQPINIELTASQKYQLFHGRYKNADVERAINGMTADELVEAKRLVQFWRPGQCNTDFHQYLGINNTENKDLSRLCIDAEKVAEGINSFPARVAVGDIYYYGLRGIETNLPLSYMWYSLAAKVYVRRHCELMTPEQRGITEHLLVNWKPGHCERELLSTGRDN